MSVVTRLSDKPNATGSKNLVGNENVTGSENSLGTASREHDRACMAKRVSWHSDVDDRAPDGGVTMR